MLGDPARRNQKLRCTYHQDRGHMTQNCRALKQHLEDLVAAGHLRDYIDQDKEVAELGNPPLEPNIEHPPRLIINHPHTDALIITVGIGKRFDVKRVLVDQGSAGDILYYDLFRKLGLSEQQLTPAAAPLVSFNSQPEWPLGRIVLPVVAGAKTLQIEFLVINTPSPYNAILGRPWIHQMEAVPSTYHQLIRFPTEHGVEQISGDQVASKHCFMAALKAKRLCIEYRR
ncbi:uncharacterized protein LOC114273694 [Camellia sinensis]|uniref:uncharacterized protein LOC114273694 n=1 Tax=Camellia sinensis TaxID=4442 RepID=UPI0010363F32|nr:uncharacterized protein LOC114273694 [Camellia sinensis]